jgi:threonine/homoserine/homoserine lactone efflux protein
LDPANLVSFAFAARFSFSQILSFLLGVSIVYIFVAIALGAGTNHLMGQYSGLSDFIRYFGDAFIIYMGIQLLRRKTRNASIKAPSMWNGIAPQIVNPKYTTCSAQRICCQPKSKCANNRKHFGHRLRGRPPDLCGDWRSHSP